MSKAQAQKHRAVSSKRFLTMAIAFELFDFFVIRVSDKKSRRIITLSKHPRENGDLV